MSLTIEYDGGGESLASSGGWSSFGDWADGLDAAEYERVVQLWEHGGVSDVAGLADHLARALAAVPPGDPTVRHTAANLLRVARRHARSEYLVVTDAVGPPTSDDEWDEDAASYDPAPGASESDASPAEGDADPHAAVAEAMVEHAAAAKEKGEDAGPGLDALRSLLDDPARPRHSNAHV